MLANQHRKGLYKLASNPLLWLGLGLRLLLLWAATATATIEWFAPFLANSVEQFSLNPWKTWLDGGNTPLAFPYGYAMWAVFLPFTAVASLLSLPASYGYYGTLLLADFALLWTLRLLLPGRYKLLVAVYWLSPIVLLATYVFGLNDIVPILLLTLAIYATKQQRMLVAGGLMIAAISAKLSMVLALPFFGIYLYRNKAMHCLRLPFIKGACLGGVTLLLPFVFSSSGMAMLFSNPEMEKVYSLSLSLGQGLVVYLVPLVYLLMLYQVWRLRRLNVDLLHATLGATFLLVVLMTPASPGWYIWALPLLIIYQAMSGRLAMLLTIVFSGLFVLSTLLQAPIPLRDGGEIALLGWLPLDTTREPQLRSLVHTMLVATGIVLILRLWRESISRNDFFRLSRKPFVIGIAGDSGAGKDTYADSLTGLFGSHSVTGISGDDYHLWDRHKPMWRVMTHLNPMANDLEGFAHDLVALADGRNIKFRHYDHSTGKKTRPLHLSSNDIIIASGLHALYLPILRECYHLKIYLDIDEDLRRHFKIQRDVHQRGHTVEKVLASFERREPDSDTFIRPQAAQADLVFSLQPINERLLAEAKSVENVRFKLVVRSRNELNELSLVRVLIGVCGLHVDMMPSVSHAGSHHDGGIQLTIEGDTTAEDIAMAAQMTCPRILEFLDIVPAWQGGVTGIMQLITLSHINQALTRRFI